MIHYEAPAGNVLGQFQQFPILPKHIWSQHTGNKGNDLKTFSNPAPIVSGGPFKLTKFKKDEIALFERNPTFYGPKPKVDAFGLRMFSNEDALIAALKANEIDAIEDVPATGIETLRKAGFDVSDVPGVDQTDFIINSTPKKTSHRELLNPKLKDAFMHAVDRKHIIQVVFLGHAKPADSIIPAATGAWHNPNLEPETFDIAAANKILDKLGYKRGSDGIRVADGHKMAYTVITPTDVQSTFRTFQILQPDFRKIGVQLTPALARLERRVRHDHRARQQVPQLRPGAVGLGRPDRPRLHALGRHVRPVRRLERQRLLQQELRRDVLEAATDPEPVAAARDRLADAGRSSTKQRPYIWLGRAEPRRRCQPQVDGARRTRRRGRSTHSRSSA